MKKTITVKQLADIMECDSLEIKEALIQTIPDDLKLNINQIKEIKQYFEEKIG